LQRWLDSGDLRRHRTSRREIADLLAVAERDLSDAQVAALSLDRRFAIAYSGRCSWRLSSSRLRGFELSLSADTTS
jgi:hypothetical protein